MGTGILIDGKVLDGECGMAGEAGHIRSSDDEPIGCPARAGPRFVQTG
jgi:glucokinase